MWRGLTVDESSAADAESEMARIDLGIGLRSRQAGRRRNVFFTGEERTRRTHHTFFKKNLAKHTYC
jgi:hypothetical protein